MSKPRSWTPRGRAIWSGGMAKPDPDPITVDCESEWARGWRDLFRSRADLVSMLIPSALLAAFTALLTAIHRAQSTSLPPGTPADGRPWLDFERADIAIGLLAFLGAYLLSYFIYVLLALRKQRDEARDSILTACTPPPEIASIIARLRPELAPSDPECPQFDALWVLLSICEPNAQHLSATQIKDAFVEQDVLDKHLFPAPGKGLPVVLNNHGPNVRHFAELARVAVANKCAGESDEGTFSPTRLGIRVARWARRADLLASAATSRADSTSRAVQASATRPTASASAGPGLPPAPTGPGS